MTADAQLLRFGLAGTGHWARVAHARALTSTPGVALSAIWGRNTEAAAALAADFGATSFRDFGAFLAGVDAVAFAVPPDVQSPLAIRAATARKHLLLEKPVALSADAADALAAAVEASGVASVVFFTARFQAATRMWIREMTEAGGWEGGQAVWLGAAHSPSSPFNTPWRREKGGLWDLGPHALSVLWPILGPVRHVTADAGRGDLTFLVLHHEGGATSTATLTLGASEAADSVSLQVWGSRGVQTMPSLAGGAVEALRTAVSELAANARAGMTAHPADVRFGRDVTQVLAAAQRQLDARRVEH